LICTRLKRVSSSEPEVAGAAAGAGAALGALGALAAGGAAGAAGAAGATGAAGAAGATEAAAGAGGASAWRGSANESIGNNRVFRSGRSALESAVQGHDDSEVTIS
jgi:hypothetical protein